MLLRWLGPHKRSFYATFRLARACGLYQNHVLVNLVPSNFHARWSLIFSIRHESLRNIGHKIRPLSPDKNIGGGKRRKSTTKKEKNLRARPPKNIKHKLPSSTTDPSLRYSLAKEVLLKSK